MRAVHKYELFVGTNLVDVPRNPQWLRIGAQPMNMAVWAIVETTQPMKRYTIHVAATGEQLPTEGQCHYIGTVQVGTGYIYHAFVMRGQL